MEFPITYLNGNDGTGLLGFGGNCIYRSQGNNTLKELQDFLDLHKGKYVFGALSYDLKNEIFGLPSENNDCIDFPNALFFVPDFVIRFNKESFKAVQGHPYEKELEFVNLLLEEETDLGFCDYDYSFQPRISKEEYCSSVRSLKEHIQAGDIYEVNFCQEFVAQNSTISDPLDFYFKLNAITKAPFSAFFSCEEFSAFCGSPERFIRRKGTQIISQPIKGTAKRGTTIEEDDILKSNLYNDPKERSENVMIVDLVRNDLSRIAEKDSVKVDELFGIYSFETVHQMISTISCQVRPELTFTEVLKATFPMGSMTGAPKLSALKLIEKHESFKRGLYSGSIGYIDPNGDFDLNVVIRSVIHNSKKGTLSCSVGSAITNSCDPEKEYEECQVKIDKILKAFNG